MYWDFSRFGDAPALIADTGVTITYRGLASLSEEAEAAAGRHAGGDSGQKPLVMLVCRNSLGALAGYAALAYREYPVLPVSADLSAGMRKELINVYRPGFLLLPEETRHMMSNLHLSQCLHTTHKLMYYHNNIHSICCIGKHLPYLHCQC